MAPSWEICAAFFCGLIVFSVFDQGFSGSWKGFSRASEGFCTGFCTRSAGLLQGEYRACSAVLRARSRKSIGKEGLCPLLISS